MKTNLWRRYAPEGAEWEPPKRRAGDMDRETTLNVITALLDRAVALYWQRRTTRPVEEVRLSS